MKQLWQRYADKRYIDAMRGLRLRIAVSRATLWVEVLVRQFWPLWALGLFTYAFVAFEGLTLFPSNAGLWVLLALIVFACVLLVNGARGLTFPSREAAINRLDSSDIHAPLAALKDYSATGKDDDLTSALWEQHLSKMAQRAARLPLLPPDLRLSSRDRAGVRLMAMTFAAMAVVFAPSGGVTAIKRAILLPALSGNVVPSVEAWATPPAYTGKPQFYLGEVADGVVLEVPVGTNVVMQLFGGSDDVELATTVSDIGTVFSGDKTTARNAKVTIIKSGVIGVRDGKTLLDEWRFIATADNAPNVIVTDELGQTTSAAMRLPFSAEDDYGIIAGTATVALELDQVDRRFGLSPEPAPRGTLVANLPLPFRGATDSISEVLIEDFSKDVWVGLPVTVTLNVRDAAGQIGEAEILGILPGKRFFVPLAAAFAEQRRDILWSPENDIRVLQVLKAVTNLPEDLMLSSGTYLRVRSAIRRFEGMLEDSVSPEERAEIAEVFWDIAVYLEDGDLGDARERLRRAQEKLLQAIEQNAEQEEISNLMEDLREATDEYLEMMASEADQNRDAQDENSAQQSIGNDQLRQMLDDLQQMAENGESEAARQLLDQMRQMLEDMQLAQQDGGSSEQIEQMQDALSQQQGLSDQTFQQLQQQLESGEDVSPEMEDLLSDQQETLREFLENLQDGQTERPRDSTAQANENMETSRDLLSEGDLGRALNEQAEAIENLRESIRRLGEEMQQAGQGRDGLQEGDTRNKSAGEDPLGRPLGRIGTTESGETFVPDENTSERARELLDEIRRRSGDIDRPDAEIEYLKRLLERF